MKTDILCGFPLRLDGSIDWALVARCWKADSAIGPIHDQSRPVRLPGDPRSDGDMILYGEALVNCDGRLIAVSYR